MVWRRGGRVLSPRGAAARPAPTPVRRIAALRAAGRTKGAHSAGRATAPRGATRPTTVCAFMNNPGQREEKGPAARRRPRAGREAYFLYVPLGGELRPPSETSPPGIVAPAKPALESGRCDVGASMRLISTAFNGALRARALPAQPIPGGGFGGDRRGPLRHN